MELEIPPPRESEDIPSRQSMRCDGWMSRRGDLCQRIQSYVVIVETERRGKGWSPSAVISESFAVSLRNTTMSTARHDHLSPCPKAATPKVGS